MAVDLKLDILYYNTPTDFEMEFGLSSRCVMRMLTSKSENIKDYLEQLSRAVSRSRLIICIGDIYNPNGILRITSKAIGLNVCSYDAAAYNVTDEKSQSVALPGNSLPLVTSQGVLAGCLIESGPQVIIFLSDSKELRKRVLKELVFEYISALAGDISVINTRENLSDVEIESEAEVENQDDDENPQTDNEAEEAEEDSEQTQQDSMPDVMPEFKPLSTNSFDLNDDPIIDLKLKPLLKTISESQTITPTVNDDQPKSIYDDSNFNIDDPDEPEPELPKFLSLKILTGALCAVLAAVVGLLLYYYIK